MVLMQFSYQMFLIILNAQFAFCRWVDYATMEKECHFT